MPKQVWKCVLCMKVFDKESDAKKCEQNHWQVKDLQILGARYVDGDRMPKEITVITNPGEGGSNMTFFRRLD